MPSQKRARKPDDARQAKPAAKRTAASEAARAPRGSLAASHEQLLQLNSRIGNRAVSRLVAEPSAAEQLPAAPVSALQRQPGEAPAVGLEGGEAGDQIEARLAANKGGGRPLPEQTRAQMERGIGADFSRVRVHTGVESQTLNRQLGAQAFTHGSDIFMAEGKYAPSSSAGQQLLAHELTHVVQQGASPVRRRAAAQPAEPAVERDADGVIRRKLAGVTAAVVQLAEPPSLKSKAKAKLTSVTSLVTGKTASEGSGKYAQIIARLESYEAQEARLLTKKLRQLDNKEKANLFGELKELELLTAGWLEQNKSLERDPVALASDIDRQDADAIISQETVDQHRYHALRMLLPRLRHEQMEVAGDRFFRNEAYSDKQADASKTQDDAFGGKVNRLDRVTHGTSEGVFIADKLVADAKTVGSTMGITLADPNAGARSVAMYQLAKLLDLGVNVIARTDFATHTTATNKQGQPLQSPIAKMGVRMEMAQGTEAAKLSTAITTQQAAALGGNTVPLDDPVLQRSLNALQLIDAIAGQIDRHWHNYYVATDGHGHVTGVVGIDLDMAFAPDHRTVAPASEDGADPLKGSHFVGMPKLVDSAFANRIVEVDPHQVELLLRNYLQPAEVAATLERLRLVKEACQQVLQRREAILPYAWGAQTSQAQLADPNNAYLGKMAGGSTKHDFATPAIERTHQKINDNTDRRFVYRLIDNLEKKIWSAAVTSAETNSLIDLILSNYVSTEGQDRRALLQSLEVTPMPSWNDLLRNPTANAGLLARLA